MMDKKQKTILIIFIFLLLIALGIVQLTGTGTIFGFDIKIPFLTSGGNNPSINNPPESIPSPEIKIISFESQKEIYSLNESAYVEFEIKNTLGIPYNLSVNWFFNNSRYGNWTNKSTEIYNVSIVRNLFYSYIPIYEKGDWSVQLLIDYNIQNYSFVKEEIRNFKVI